jgi:5'-methylthioadenosine phosphorylase
MTMVKLGLIGGSGLDDPRLIHEHREIEVTTPYGDPSSTLVCGTLDGVELVILARHGRRHTIPPTQINNRANIRALMDQGCTHVIASAACGSLREDIPRGALVIPDQFIDFTRRRVVTFFDEFDAGIENSRHTPMADPFDETLRQILIRRAHALQLHPRERGTLLTIEGPRFSTRAESLMFRQWGADLINMTVAPEAILAREIGLPYAVIAVATDYDCWKTDEPALCIQEIVKVFNQNVENVKRLMIETLGELRERRSDA